MQIRQNLLGHPVFSSQWTWWLLEPWKRILDYNFLVHSRPQELILTHNCILQFPWRVLQRLTRFASVLLWKSQLLHSVWKSRKMSFHYKVHCGLKNLTQKFEKDRKKPRKNEKSGIKYQKKLGKNSEEIEWKKIGLNWPQVA